jgi:hypothetical protein
VCQQSLYGGGYEVVGFLLERLCNEKTNSGLDPVEQEICPWDLTVLSLAEQ